MRYHRDVARRALVAYTDFSVLRARNYEVSFADYKILTINYCWTLGNLYLVICIKQERPITLEEEVYYNSTRGLLH